LWASLKGLSPNGQAIIARQGVYEAEQRLVQLLEPDLSNWIAGVRSAIASYRDVFAEPVAGKPLGEYFGALGTWREKREAHRKEYDDVKKRAATHEETLRQMQAPARVLPTSRTVQPRFVASYCDTASLAGFILFNLRALLIWTVMV
jgi:hypothetical protein